MSILIANDNHSTARRLTRVVEGEIPDQVVITRATIDDALDAIKQNFQNLWLGLIDYHFGDSILGEEHKGTRIIREWRTMEAQLAPNKKPACIVLASGSGFQEDFDRAMDAGANGILDMNKKPAEYIAALRELLRKNLCSS